MDFEKDSDSEMIYMNVKTAEEFYRSNALI